MAKTDRDSVERLAHDLINPRMMPPKLPSVAKTLRTLLTRAEQAEVKLAILDDDQSLTVAYLQGAKDGKPRVKPLEWIECADGTLHDPNCQYELVTDGGYWRVTKGVTGGGSYVADCSTLEAAKAAAQADYERRILNALEPGEPDTQPDPADVWDEAIEAAAHTLDNHDSTPCYPARSDLWSDDEIAKYTAGQMDAALSWQYAIRATPNPYRKDRTDDAE